MFSLFCVFAGVYAATRTVLWYFSRVKDHKKFANRGIPGPKPSLLDGNLNELRKSGALQHDVVSGWIERFGNVVGYYLGAQRYLIINDLNALQQIFISNQNVFRNRPYLIVDAKPIIYSVLVLQDDAWRRVRRVISPIFSYNKVTSPKITGDIESSVDALMKRIKTNQDASDQKKSFEADVYAPMQAASLDVIARTALNIHEDVHNPQNSLLKAVREYFSDAQNIAVDLATVFTFLRPIMTFVNNNLTSGRMTDMIVKHIHEQILEIAKNPVDLKSQNFLHNMVGSFSQKHISKDELVGNAHIILLAGYETTANAVSFVLYMLAKYPDVQNRLRSYFEMDSDKSGNDYFEMVWLETLRIMPPVTMFLVREAAEDVVINGTYIEKGTVVQAPVWQIHHDPEVWSEPFEFDPERFTPEKRKSMHQMAFVPFGSGPRICLGMALANHEARLIVRRFVTDFSIQLGDKFIDPLPLKYSTVFINPKDTVTLKFTATK